MGQNFTRKRKSCLVCTARYLGLNREVSLKELALTPSQLNACRHTGPALVLAGPGAGKTRTLLGRLLYLLEQGIAPEQIILLTFTVKAAAELKERLEKFEIEGVRVETFHGLAYELLRQAGLVPRIATAEEQERLFQEVLKAEGLSPRGALKQLERLRVFEPESELLKRYEKSLKAAGLYDFGLLLKEATRANPLAETPLHLLVDEFQDLNPELIAFLKSFGRATFYLVGDPAQAIYGFRGATPELVKGFIDQIAGLKRFFLEESFRVPENILCFAETLRDNTFPTPTLKSRKGGGTLGIYAFKGPEHEAREVARMVTELLGGLQLESSTGKSLSPGEIAVVARLRRLLSPVKEALVKAGVPVEEPKTGEELARLKDILSRAQTLEEARAELKKGRFGREVNYLLAQSQSLEELKFRVELLGQGVLFKKQGVALLTIHETKGLEFEAVFLIGAEEGLLPFTLLPETNLEEERRLAYVALTRAGARFTATFVRQRMLFGRRVGGRPSPFLAGLKVEQVRPRSRPQKPRQKVLF